MDVLLVRNVFLVEPIHVDLLLAVAGPQEQEEVALELFAVIVDELLGVLANDEHLADVALGLGVHLEAVRIAALLLADLAVPTKALEALRLHTVGDIFRRPNLGFAHAGLWVMVVIVVRWSALLYFELPVRGSVSCNLML